MTTVFAIWIVLVLVSAPVGSLLLRWCGVEIEPLSRLFLGVWIGLLALCAALLWLALLAPLNVVGPLFLGLAGGAAALTERRRLREQIDALRAVSSPMAAAVLGGVVGGSLVLSSGPVTYTDTGIYHYQMVLWLNEHGVVPGLGLIHGRFGFVSSWFPLTAALEGVSPGRGHIGSAVSGLVLVLVALQAVHALARVRRSPNVRSDWVLAVGLPLAAIISLRVGVTRSLSPDLVVALGIVVVAWMLVLANERVELGPLPRASRPVLAGALLLATLLVSVKPSAAVAFVVVAVVWWWSTRPTRRRMFHVSVAVGGVLGGPVLASIVSTGCLVYPLAASCFEPSWGVSVASAEAERVFVTEYARWDEAPHGGAMDVFWVVAWVDRHPLRAAVLVAYFVAALVLLWALRGSSERVGDRGLRHVVVLSLAGVVFTFLTAPTLRFMGPYGAVLVAVAAAVVLPAMLRRLSPRTVGLGVAVIGAAGVWLLYAGAGWTFQPPAPFVPPSVNDNVQMTAGRSGLLSSRAGEVVYSVPRRGELCWATALPCAPHPIQQPLQRAEPLLPSRTGFVRAAGSETE